MESHKEYLRPYLRALCELATTEEQQTDWLNFLQYSAERVKAYRRSSGHTAEHDTAEALAYLLQEQSACLTDQTIRFLHLLAEYRRLDSLPELASAFETWLDEQQGRVDVEVISAFPLSQQTLARLQAGLCNRLHQLKGSLRQQ